VTLEVRTSNVEAITMYEELDYERAGTRRAYYQDGEDAVVMTKRLAIAV
jgi:ribosomal-protein-alanine N-acetyltransferase